MHVKLTRKLAEHIDGVDLSRHEVGDIFDIPVIDAHLLIAEGWAEPHIAEVKIGNFRPTVSQVVNFPHGTPAGPSDVANRVLRTLERIRRIRRIRSGLDQNWLMKAEHRRAEDSIREELHDARARTVVISKTGS